MIEGRPPPVSGFLDDPPLATDRSIDVGRHTLYDVQWVENPDEQLARCTLTFQQLFNAAENQMIWTDQRVQRGIKPEAPPDTPVELPLAAGYPDERYVFDAANADDITEKLLSGRRLHLHPLTWNLRPGKFKAFWDSSARRVYVYDGRIYLPDSHHRHQALVKAMRLYRETPQDYPHFSPDRQTTVDIYFMTVEEEMEFFFEKNQLTRATARSKAWDLTSQDPYAVLAKAVIDSTPSLVGNVNRVTDTLSAKNAQVMTLSTLRGVMVEVVPDLAPTSEAIEATAPLISEFYEVLAAVRSELGRLEVWARQQVRNASLVDSGVMMYAYAALARRFLQDAHNQGLTAAKTAWESRLRALAANSTYESGEWRGDFFSRSNPLWKAKGVLQDTPSGKVTISNTRQTRAVVAMLLLERLGLPANERAV